LSDNGDKESKTNEPTDKKTNDAIAKGNVPVSQEVQVLFSFAAILVICSIVIVPAVDKLTIQLKILLESAGSIRLNSSHDTGLLFSGLAEKGFLYVFPVLFCLMAAGVVAALVQNPFQISSERIQPQLSRISPAAGFARIFGLRGFIDFGKSLIKFLGIGLIVIFIFKSESKSALSMMIKSPQFIPEVLLNLTIKLVVSVTITALILAVADTVWSRISWRRDLRMSHQEIKEEHKDSEGNPMVKVRARSLARQRSSRRMMSSIPKATLIITNPTHYAIALRYVRSEGGAPIVLAKGVDIIALKIRKIAEDLDIAIIENKPLARAMYEKIEINAEIPQEFFLAVAELIHFLQMKSVVQSVKSKGN